MKDPAQIILALMVTVGFFSCVFYMLNWGFPPENKDILNAFTQLLGTIWTLIMNFFFGSSSSSKTKDETISAIASAPATPVIVPNAESVTVETKEGHVAVDNKLRT